MPTSTGADGRVTQAQIAVTAPEKPIGMRREAGEPAGLERTPGLLRHGVRSDRGVAPARFGDRREGDAPFTAALHREAGHD